MLTELKSPLAMVCHDAGAANIVFAWLRAEPSSEVRVFARGPAANLWKQNPMQAVSCDSLDQAMAGAGTLLSGTGWASDLEHDARRCARQLGVFSIAVLDHWTNYRERFTRAGETILPDEFWVTDEDAQRIACETFPRRTVRLLPNLYVQEQLRRIDAAPTSGAELLYLLEPVRNDWGRGEAGELQALDYFASRRSLLDLPAGTAIRLRPHPSDAPGKYDDWIARHPEMNIVLDDTADLAHAIGRAAWVAGCETFAMTVALLAGRRVICTLPPWAPQCRLPHRDLIHLKTLGAGAK
jgi:hypothetical protein